MVCFLRSRNRFGLLRLFLKSIVIPESMKCLRGEGCIFLLGGLYLEAGEVVETRNTVAFTEKYSFFPI